MAKPRSDSQRTRAAVRGSSPEVLAKLVLDLYEISGDNRIFIETRLGKRGAVLEPYKERIREALYPDPFSRTPIRIAEARRAVTEYRKASGDENGLLELMIYYVECGTACTVEFGDIDEPFYASIESMYDRFLNALKKADPGTKMSYRSRAKAVVEQSKGIGWGFHDGLADRYGEEFQD